MRLWLQVFTWLAFSSLASNKLVILLSRPEIISNIVQACKHTLFRHTLLTKHRKWQTVTHSHTVTNSQHYGTWPQPFPNTNTVASQVEHSKISFHPETGSFLKYCRLHYKRHYLKFIWSLKTSALLFSDLIPKGNSNLVFKKSLDLHYTGACLRLGVQEPNTSKHTYLKGHTAAVIRRKIRQPSFPPHDLRVNFNRRPNPKCRYVDNFTFFAETISCTKR